MNPSQKPVIGISCGDINGIGPEIIIKTFADNRILEMCTPVLFISHKVINFYRKSLPDHNLNYQIVKELTRLNPKQVNVFQTWEEDAAVTPGQMNEIGGRYAVRSLINAAEALKRNEIHGLVTAPIHKKNIQSADFNFTGHTPFLKHFFNAKEVVMILFSNAFRMALLTEHVPLSEVSKLITKELIVNKLILLNESLRKDFDIEKPKIAVLALNPHAGDEGLIGTEEEAIIRPAVKEAKNNNIQVIGPYSADAFFARHYHNRFDAVLAMYHDQGLVPFKALAFGEGVNYSAGLPYVRTSPDHGTAFDISGKGIADESSFRTAVFECMDIINRRSTYDDNRKNPLRKRTAEVLANAEDEEITDN